PSPTAAAECGGPPAAAPARLQTGTGLGPDPSATRRADVYPWWSSQTRTGTLANQPGGFMQACRKDTASRLNGRTFGFSGLKMSNCNPAANRQSSFFNSP